MRPLTIAAAPGGGAELAHGYRRRVAHETVPLPEGERHADSVQRLANGARGRQDQAGASRKIG